MAFPTLVSVPLGCVTALSDFPSARSSVDCGRRQCRLGLSSVVFVFQCSTLPNHPLPHSHMPLAPAVLISCSRLLLKNEARIFSLLLASSAALATIYTPLPKASSHYTIGLKSRVSLSSPGLHVDEDPRGQLLSVWTSTTKKISYSSPLPQTQYMRKE